MGRNQFCFSPREKHKGGVAGPPARITNEFNVKSEYVWWLREVSSSWSLLEWFCGMCTWTRSQTGYLWSQCVSWMEKMLPGGPVFSVCWDGNMENAKASTENIKHWETLRSVCLTWTHSIEHTACKSLMKTLKKNSVSGSFAMAWLVLPDLAAIFLERQADAKSSFQRVRDVIKEGTYCVYHGDRKHNPFLTSMALTESTLLITGCAVGVLIACCLSFRFCWSMFGQKVKDDWIKTQVLRTARFACHWGWHLCNVHGLLQEVNVSWNEVNSFSWIVTISRVIYLKMDMGRLNILDFPSETTRQRGWFCLCSVGPLDSCEKNNGMFSLGFWSKDLLHPMFILPDKEVQAMLVYFGSMKKA